MVLMARFAVPPSLQLRVLTIGIVLALVLRGIRIAVGAAAVERFSWVFLIFGAFLLWTAWGLLRENGDDEEPVPGPALLFVVGFLDQQLSGGALRRPTSRSLMAKVTDMRYDRSVARRLFGYGVVVLEGGPRAGPAPEPAERQLLARRVVGNRSFRNIGTPTAQRKPPVAAVPCRKRCRKFGVSNNSSGTDSLQVPGEVAR